MRRVIGFALLTAFSSLAQADWYAGGALGQVRAKAHDFRFHNPVGAPLAVPPGAGSHIPMNSVNDSDTASDWSVRGGYLRAGSPWRFEVDFTKRNRVSMQGFADFGATGNFQQLMRIRSQSLLFMAYYDHALDRDWSLYGGLGAGWARNRADGKQGENLGGTGFFPSAKHSEGAWAVALGVSRKFTPRVTADLGYRYASLGKADTGTTDASFAALVPFAMNPNERLEAKLRMQELRLGLNYRF